MMKKIISFLIICLISAGSFTACKNTASPSEAPLGEKVKPKEGGVLKLGCVYVDSMNPLITEHASVYDFLSLVYEGLFVLNEDQRAEGILAKGYSVSNNNTVYTISLKKGIRFHNGKSFTAEDVTSTLSYISLYSPGWKNIMQYIASYTAPDDYTVVITLNTPKTDFENNLDFPILPSGLKSEDFICPNDKFIPVGTGMYKYHSTESYKNIILKANDDWRGGKTKPYIDTVNIEIMSDEETIVSAFDAGTIDAITTSWRSFGELELTSDVYNTFENEQNRFTFIGINSVINLFDTAEERTALLNSIDRNKLTDDIMLGRARVASSPIRDGVYFDMPPYEEEESVPPSAAKPKGETDPVECKLLYNSESKTKSRIAAAVKQQLESKGYIVQLDGQSMALYNDKVAVGDYDLYIGEVQLVGSCDLQFMFSSPLGGICNYDDSEFRTLVTNLDLALGENEKKIAWQNFEKYYKTVSPQIPLYFTNRAAFVNKRIGGSLKPNLSVPFLGLESMYVK